MMLRRVNIDRWRVQPDEPDEEEALVERFGKNDVRCHQCKIPGCEHQQLVIDSITLPRDQPEC
jgi:hypothetical protein